MAHGLRNWKFKEFLVQAIQSESPQTLKTMKMSVAHSGISKEKYFQFTRKK